MGVYVNQQRESKEEFLNREGHPMTLKQATDFKFDGKNLPVILLFNPTFTAAGIAFDEREGSVIITVNTTDCTGCFCPKIVV